MKRTNIVDAVFCRHDETLLHGGRTQISLIPQLDIENAFSGLSHVAFGPILQYFLELCR